MKPVYQTDLSKETGNCLQAAVASLLELKLEEVPHFILFDDEWWCIFQEFFAARNINAIWLPDIQPLGSWHIASVRSPRLPGETHAVVCDPDGNVVHDPHPDGLTSGEVEIVGCYWFTVRDPSKLC